MNEVIISILIAIVPTVLGIFLFFKFRRLQSRIDTLTTGTSEGNLEQLVHRFIQTLESNKATQAEIHKEYERITQEASQYLRKLGIVRFQAFDGTGGDQSFALAVLDQNNNGFVISSLYGRDISKVYSKKITKGISPDYKLTEEEQKAIDKAVNSK